MNWFLWTLPPKKTLTVKLFIKTKAKVKTQTALNMRVQTSQNRDSSLENFKPLMSFDVWLTAAWQVRNQSSGAASTSTCRRSIPSATIFSSVSRSTSIITTADRKWRHTTSAWRTLSAVTWYVDVRTQSEAIYLRSRSIRASTMTDANQVTDSARLHCPLVDIICMNYTLQLVMGD